MAEERNGYQWRDFFFLYDPSCDGCGQSRAVHGNCFQQRGQRDQLCWHAQRCDRRRCGSIDHHATGQRGCHRWSNGDFLRNSSRHRSSQLPMAEERNGYQWRDFFFLHDPSCDGC
jgi:hypothetical protein